MNLDKNNSQYVYNKLLIIVSRLNALNLTMSPTGVVSRTNTSTHLKLSMKNEQFIESGKCGEVYYTIAEVCKILTISKPTLWRKTKHKGLKKIKIGGVVRYRKSDLDRWLDAHQSAGNSN